MSTLVDPWPWEDEIVRSYLTATAQQKEEPKRFYDTHLDIDRIYAKFLPRYQDEFVTQEEFRDELIDSPIDADIRTFIIRGETGSGKSQLCQWLDYELAGEGEGSGVDNRIPLHIKANQTNIEHIISTLAEPLGEDPAIRQVTELDAEKVAEAIITNLEANPGQQLAEANIERIIQDGGLQSMLESNIEDYQNGLEEGDETEFDPNLISKEDYRDIALKLGTESVFHKNSQVLRKTLRDEIHRHFSHIIGVDDFQGQLREYAQRYVEELEKRPVIICEDVTTFSVLKEQLLDQIIQVESATYDIVLGYTTGFEQDDLQDALGTRGDEDALTYLQDRSEGYLSLTQDGVTYFLNNTLSVNLVRKYLTVIKRESGADIDESTEAAYDKLYPFNRAFIQMAYDRLLEEGSTRRTPRVLLQKVVRRVLLSDEQPYEVVDKNPNVDDQVTPIDPSSYPNQLQKLATWYGYRDEIRDDSDEILIHHGVLETFGFETDGEGTVTHEGAEYVAFRSNKAATRILGEADDSRPSIPPSTKPESRLEDSESPKQSTGTQTKSQTKTRTTTVTDQDVGAGTDRREDQLNDFFEWVETGDSYPSSDVLRSGAEEILDMWHDPTKLSNTNSSRDPVMGIYYTRGQEVPVSIEGPNERDGLSVMLPFGKEHTDIYLDILEVGMSDDGELPETATVEQLRSWASNSVVRFRRQMRRKIEDNEEGCLPAEMTIEHVILLGKLLLSNAEFGTTDFGREAVFDRRVPKERTYEGPIREAFPDESGLKTTLGSLQDRRREIEGLINGFFLLKKNLVDHDRLSPVRAEIASEPMKYVQLAQQIDTEKLDFPSAYNIGTTRSNAKTSVEAFLNAVSDYAIELSRLSDDDLESHFDSELEPIQKWHDDTHRADELALMLDTLMECLGTFGVTKLERWERVQEKLNAETSINLTEFNETVSSFVELETETPLERVELLHEFQMSQEEHAAWEVYDTFDEIIEELSKFEVSESDDLRTRIRELDELSEYETKRSNVVDAVNNY